MLDEMKALAKQKDICVLATSSGNEPHCSLMAYATDDACTEIYMVTYRNTHKYKNLMENSSVSLLIDTREEDAGPRRPSAKALTVTGVFQRIDNEEKKGVVLRRLLERHPHLKNFVNQPDAEPFCVKVSSFLLLDGLTDAYYQTV
jgi:nitroimidazol reductase NimA-like FMN-containing flavoprotein (pyridoxamine 5'-phosphate oxidase superfamily)